MFILDIAFLPRIGRRMPSKQKAGKLSIFGLLSRLSKVEHKFWKNNKSPTPLIRFTLIFLSLMKLKAIDIFQKHSKSLIKVFKRNMGVACFK